MNKKGKKMSTGITVLIVLLAVGIIAGLLFATGVVNTKQTIVGGGANQGGNGNTVISTAIPTVAYNTLDNAQPGVAVTTSGKTVFLNGELQATAPTTASVGDKLDVLFLNGTTYHSGVGSYTIKDGANILSAKLDKNASLTIAVYTTGKSSMTNNGGAVNQSVATGSAPTMEVDFTGTSMASTNDMVCVLEGSNASNVNKLELSGFGATLIGKEKPSVYSGTGAIWVYSVPAIKDASLRTGSLYAESKTGKTMAGDYFVITCYTKENFVDTLTGKLSYAIEDSAGTLKSLNTYTFKGYFQ